MCIRDSGIDHLDELLLFDEILLPYLLEPQDLHCLYRWNAYIEAFFALGQFNGTVGSSAKQYVGDRVLIDLDVLV